MYLMRVLLPDRPGTLGAVASAVGSAGADIAAVEVVDRRNGIAVDDFIITMPNGSFPDMLVSACHRVDGVEVQWISRYRKGTGVLLDIDALERMVHAPDTAAELLTSLAPTVFHATWAALISICDHARVLHATDLAPDLTPAQLAGLGPFDKARWLELEPDWINGWGEATLAMAPIRDDRAILVGRQGGPDFLDSEVARLRHLASFAP